MRPVRVGEEAVVVGEVGVVGVVTLISSHHGCTLSFYFRPRLP